MKRSSLRVRESLARLLWQDNVSRGTARFRPRLEWLEQRRLLAVATDLASIEGRVFDDFTGNGFDPGEQVAGAELSLYRDNGDGAFSAGTDTLIDTTVSDSNGLYEFSRLEAGDYFVLQPEQTASGRTLQRSVSPPIEIDATAAQGRVVMAIDSFDTTAQSVRDDSNDGVPVTSAVAAPEAIGGERDLFVNKTSDNGAVQLSANDPLLPDLLSFDSQQFGNGVRRVVWDGVDGDATAIDDSGLAATDLTSGGEAAGLRLQIGADLAGGTAIVRIYSDDGAAGASRYSEASIPIPATGGLPSSAEFIPFSDFAAIGGGANFSQVGAIELEIAGQSNVNGTVELVGTAGATMFTQNFANFETADLSLSKTVDDPRPDVGQNVTFEVTVTNSGPDAATAIVIQESLPSGFDLVRASASAGTYNATSGQWEIDRLASEATATLTLVATVTDVGATTNTAEIIAATEFDPDSTPNNDALEEDDQDAVTVTPTQIDLSLTKSASEARPNLGSEVTFVVNVQNAGPDTASGVAVTDVLPAGVELISSTPSQGNITFDGSTGVWTVGTLTSGGSATLTLTARVTAIGTWTNTAEVTAGTPGDVDSTPGNNNPEEDDQDSVSFTTPVADLALTKTVSDSTPELGETVTFEVTLTNSGPDAATDIVVTDTLSEGLNFVSATPSAGGSFDPATGRWTIGELANGATATLTIEAVVEAFGPQNNTAEVTAATQGDSDSTPGNNDPAEDDQASAALRVPTADLSLTKTVSDSRPNVGEEITFVVSVANAGPDAATGVEITDVLPAGVELISSTPSQGNITFNDSTGIWTVGTLASGGSATLTLAARVTASGTGTNAAEVTAASPADPDSEPGNGNAEEDDQASVSFTTPVADLSLTKTVSDTSPTLGDTVTFEVTLTNSGPDAATDIVVTDTLSGGLEFVSATPSTGSSFDASTGRWTIGELASGATATLTIRAVAEERGPQTNSAEITAVTQADPDSSPDNNDPEEDDQAIVTLTPGIVDLSLAKSISEQRPNLGSQVTFVVSVENAGPDTATGVEVTDVLPAGVELISSTPSQGSISFEDGTGVWTVGTLTSGGSATLTLVARVVAIGTWTNTAEITAGRPGDIDSTPGNNNPEEDDQDSVSFTTPVADLALTKTVSDAAPGLGDTVTFVVTLVNSGPDAATNVIVTDTLSEGLDFVSATPSVGSRFNSVTGEWSIDELADDATATLTIQAVVRALGPQTNTAEVTAVTQGDADSTPGNNDPDEDDQANVALQVPSADLSLTKAIDDATPGVGSQVTFTLVVSNAGPNTANDVTVGDSLPEGLTLVSSDPSVGSYDAATGRWTISTLAPGASAQLLLRATADRPGDITNTAEILSSSLPDTDSTPGNGDPEEDDFASVTLSPELVDLALTKALDDLTPNVGDSIEYILSLTNQGPSTATGVIVTDPLPAGVAFENATASQGTYDAATGVWSVGEIAPGVVPTLRIEATVGYVAGATNSAEVTAVDQPDADSTPGNGAPEEDDFATVTFTTRVADLSLTKTVDDATLDRDDEVTFTLTLSNAGPEDATGITVRDLLPAGLTFISATPSAGTYDPDDGLWTVPGLAAASNATLTITASATSRDPSTNTAEVIATGQFDPDSTPGNGDADEDDFAAVTVTPTLVDISVDAAVDTPQPNAGQIVQITFTTNNAGPATATGLVFQTALPEGLTLISAAPTAGTFDAATGRWTVNSLAANSQTQLVLTVRVDTAGPREIPIELIDLDQFDVDSTPGNGVEEEDDQTAAIIFGPRVLSKRLFLSR